MPRRCRDQVPFAQDRDVPQILSSSGCADTCSPPEPASTRCSAPGTRSMVSAHVPPASFLCALSSATSSASALADDRMLQNALLPGLQQPVAHPRAGAQRCCHHGKLLWCDDTPTTWQLTCNDAAIAVIFTVAWQPPIVAVVDSQTCYLCCPLLLHDNPPSS